MLFRDSGITAPLVLRLRRELVDGGYDAGPQVSASTWWAQVLGWNARMGHH
jgi:hypothetical protein